MAENYVSWEKRNAAPGFGYAGGTQDILSAYNGLNHRKSDVRYADNQPLLKEQIKDLYQLKKDLEREEREFFELFGYVNQDRKTCFRLLRDKVKQWNATKAENLLNNATNKEFWDILVNIEKQAFFMEMNNDDWQDILNTSFNTQEVKQLLESNPNLNVAEILNTILEKNGKGKYAIGGSSTLLANLTVTLKNGEIEIKSDRNNISLAMQQKITRDLKKYLEKQNRGQQYKVNYDFQKLFDTLFEKSGITPEGQFYILKAIKNDYGSVTKYYDFNSNQSRLKGFLGEIYTTAFLLFMAGKNNLEALRRITPTGAMREVGGKKPELIIDIWLYGAGIQVKNYELNKVLKSGFEFRNTLGAGEFITNKLQLESRGTSNTASVGDILLNFFTAYDYNQDYGETGNLSDEIMKSDAYRYWKITRARMTEKIRDEKSFTNIITPYAHKLMGISRKFSTEDNMFINGQEYHNTFFNISGEYIPSSVLVQAIIDIIEKKSQKESFGGLLDIKARFSSHSLSGLDKWSPKVDNNLVAKVFENREKYADSSRVSYSMIVDVQELSANLLNYIK